MNTISFTCAYCQQKLEASSDITGEITTCPSCDKKIKIPETTTKHSSPKKQKFKKAQTDSNHPLIIRASVKSLYAKYIWDVIKWILVTSAMLFITLTLKASGSPNVARIIAWLWGLFFVLFFFSLLKLWLDYRRIKHTVYRIYPKKIETSSYLFRFLGAYNNSVNLAQLRQIKSSVNTFLDLWFFKCGKVILTVSGDVADFEIKNVYRPAIVRRQVEELAFGKESVYRGAVVTPEVEGTD